MDAVDLICGNCAEFVTVPPGAGYKRDTKRVGNCTAARPAWVGTHPSPLIAYDNPMAEVCHCFRRKTAGN